jgi:DNA-binding LacI/PurR family transcriptional regulator
VGHVPSARKLAEYAADRARVGANGWRDLVEHAPFSMEGGAAAAARLIAAGVSAVVAASDALALGAVRAARRAGLHVPADLSVVGFDDSMYLTVTDPPLTTLRQPVAAMSAAAVSLLEAQINGNAIARPETRFEPELILRGSTGPVSR